ncbi:MAG: STAS/SEC14 domain-containing protein [Gammaproteobacteria bacterium]|nr:STAS/SEC14 domain-containing protein [Gammaproteobacteria bacterium]
MLSTHQTENSNIIEFILDGEMSRIESDKAVKEIRLIEIIKTIGRMEPKVIMDDLKLGPKYQKDISQIAIVADQGWIKWLGAMIIPLVNAKARLFSLDQIDKARHWIQTARPLG